MKSWLDADVKMFCEFGPFGVIFLFSINLVTHDSQAWIKNEIRQGNRVESSNAGQMMDLPISHAFLWPWQNITPKASFPLDSE